MIDDLSGSDHYPICTSLNLNNRDSLETKRPKWIFDRAVWILYKRNTEFCENKLCLTVNDVYDHIKEIIHTSAQEYIPKTSSKIRKRMVPWWNDELASAIKSRKKH